MKKLLVSIAVVLFLVCAADAAQPKISPDRINTSRPFPSITMDEDANITLDGGWIQNFWVGGEVRTLSYAGVIVTLSPWLIPLAIGASGYGGDDFRVMNAALEYINDSNYTKTWVLYGQNFYPDQVLLIPSKIKIYSHGSTIWPDPTNTTVRDAIIADRYPSEAKDFHDIYIKGLILDGIDKTYVNYCLNLSRAKYCKLDSVSALHAIKDGFLIRDDSWGFVLSDCYTYDNGERGVHFAPGPNFAEYGGPNTAIIRGGRIMADDEHSIFIEAGNDIWISNVDINSAGVGVYCLADSPTIESCYMEALTYGFYWGDGSNRVDNALIRNNHLYSVSNFMASVNQSNTRLEGNFIDGVAIDTFSGWATGTGSEQSIDFPATLYGTPHDVRVWNIETGATSNPVFYTDESWTCINVTAQNGINYRYKVQTSL